jgi:immune inhibitor A
VRTVPTRGELRLLAIRASFKDMPLAEPRDHFAGTPDSLLDRLAAYYAEVSTGRLRIVPYLAEAVVTLPLDRARYVQRPAVLATDGIAAFARTATSDADRRALADAHAVVVFFPGPGRESFMKPGPSDDPWSNFADLAPPVAGFGAAIVVASTEYAHTNDRGERVQLSSFGVLCHEFGHLLGLPELYAPGAAVHEGIGKWGLMGQGTWVSGGNSPPHMEAWSKLQLGWVDAVTITESVRDVRLPAVTDEPLVVKIPAVPDKPQEYYLLENRQKVGFDAALPGAGILVWHVDETVTGFRTAQSKPEHKLLHLVSADGRNDLDRGTRNGGNRGDAGDPWAGPPRRRIVAGGLLGLMGAIFVGLAVYRATRGRQFLLVVATAAVGAGALALGAWLGRSPICGPQTPGMAPYGGQPERVVLRRFSPSAMVMSVDVLIAPSAPPGTGSSRVPDGVDAMGAARLGGNQRFPPDSYSP